MIALLIVAGALVAFANGANDVCKGIASLVAGGAADRRRAIGWAVLWTAVGATAGGLYAGALVTTFGKGLLAPGVVPSQTAALAALAGAGAWVLLATRIGAPVSTTHALVGAIAGAGVVAYGIGGIQWSSVGAKVAAPLLLGPLVAIAATALITRAFAGKRKGASAKPADCLCISPGLASLAPSSLASSSPMPAATVTPLQLYLSPAAECRDAGVGVTVDHAHWLTAAAVSFARGMNDAPKIAALVLAGLAGAQISRGATFALVGTAMVAGGLLAGRRVLRLLADELTTVDHRQGFVTSLTTAVMVGAGAVYGLPLSTTHVSAGALVGGGLASGRGVQAAALRSMLVVWVVTVPVSALLAGLALAGLGLTAW